MGIFSSEGSETDAISFLDQQHNEVEELFSQFDDSDGAAGRKIFEQIRDKLRVHAQIEEEIFYPPVKQAKSEETGEEIAEAVEEHYQIKLIIDDIDSTRPTGDVFKGKMKVLKEDVEHHVQEERDDVFPDARNYLGEEKLEELGEQLRERAEELMARGTRRSSKRTSRSGSSKSSKGSVRATAGASKSSARGKGARTAKSRAKARG